MNVDNESKNNCILGNKIKISQKFNSSKTKKTSKKPKRERQKYLCNYCKKEFLGSSDLRKHLRIHTDERPFICAICNKKFRQAVCLRNHIASIHGTDEKFECEHCHKVFPIKERLRLHMRIHTGEKPYRCSICMKKFARGGQLRQHLITHNSSKKFNCTQCLSGFTNMTNLKLHMKSHEINNEFICKVCNKEFFRLASLRKHLMSYHANSKQFHCKICKKTLKGHLAQHMKIHENIRPFICDICDAQFSQKSQLNVHHRMHSGERPYRCQVCWQAFAHSSVLNIHIRKHTGEKPFKCPLCCNDNEIGFSQLPHLKTHMKTIHGKDKPYMCYNCKEFFKTKHILLVHTEKCLDQSNQNINMKNNEDSNNLSHLRLLVAVLLKKISTEEHLKQLGFEKRLIDNVIKSALQIAGRNFYENNNLPEIENFRNNINEFLEWTVPKEFMTKFKESNKTVEELLEELSATYLITKTH